MGFNYKFKFNEPEFVVNVNDKEITCKLTLVDGPIDIFILTTFLGFKRVLLIDGIH